MAIQQRQDLIQFRIARGKARSAIRKAKNRWFVRKAKDAECTRFGGKEVWKCIRDLQRGWMGRRAARVVYMEDEEGNPCITVAEQKGRWRRHFNKVLNVQSQFHAVELSDPVMKLGMTTWELAWHSSSRCGRQGSCQGRLQGLADRELPDSQCGFRKGQGCTDMNFVVRQLVEKAVEHKDKQFVVFA